MRRTRFWLVSLVLHGAALAALVWWPPQRPRLAAPDIVVELEPVPAPPDLPAQETLPPELAQQDLPQPEPAPVFAPAPEPTAEALPEPITAAAPEPTPTVDVQPDAEPAPDPPLPAAVEAPPEPDTRSVPVAIAIPTPPAPPAPLLRSAPLIRPAGHPPRPVTAAAASSPAPSSPSPLPPAARGTAPDYTVRLVAWLRRFETYPEAARRQGRSGLVHLRIRLDATGRVLGHQVIAAEGGRDFIAAAERMLRDASPLPPPPGLAPGAALELELRLPYRLDP